jgi:hypothetical protein
MNNKKTMYENQTAVAALNKVLGFNPLDFMRKTVLKGTNQEILYLDLKFKKLWFRLAYPKGYIKKTTLQITEQVAVIEAKIFLDRNDKEPVAAFVAQRNAEAKTGSLYVQDAQYAAENQALIDAGFGLQFCDVSQGIDVEIFDAGTEQTATAVEQKTLEIAPETETLDEIIAKDMAGEIEQVEINNQDETIETAQPQNDDITPHLSYTADMSVEEILKAMTLEEAGVVTVDTGVCKGWLMSDVLEKRPGSLKWYINGYTGENNIMRAAAKKMFDYKEERQAA